MRTPHEASTAHPAAALLPWYLTGTLKESERQTVDEHLSTCAECRAELESLAKLRAPLQAALSDEPMPILHVKQSVMAQVQADRGSHHVASATAPDGGAANAFEQWFRNLFEPRWIPALAATLLIGQLALLLWTAGSQTVSPLDAVTTRGIPSASVRVILVFQESASEARIRAVIRGLNGRLVDGPTADGVYTVEVPLAESAALDTGISRLQQQPDLIRRAERALR